CAVSIVLLWLGEGVKGLIEIPSIFSNILSYARLMAIGLASVKLAEVVNEFATEFIHQGGIYIFYAVLLLVVGHVINNALGIIGPFLHSLRLHYVEFFTKFFKGGGKEYIPFGREID
ncbi:MAG: V-type ATP synthase subunit I, V-type H+-transporting ATPase subunit I, partial [archaeon GW2011_AR3]